MGSQARGYLVKPVIPGPFGHDARATRVLSWPDSPTAWRTASTAVCLPISRAPVRSVVKEADEPNCACLLRQDLLRGGQVAEYEVEWVIDGVQGGVFTQLTTDALVRYDECSGHANMPIA